MTDNKRFFILENGIVIRAPEKSCLFCAHLTDIFYDSEGIWGHVCDIDGDCENGARADCDKWKERKE